MASQNDFVQGINLAGLDTASGADLEQLVREAVPNSHIGYNLTGATPDVASNDRYSRYLYYTSPGQWLKYYDTGTSTWTNLPIPDGIVTSGKIVDGSVTLDKLDVTSGSALQYLRINAGGTEAEWASFALSDASVTTAKLVAGTSDQVLVTNDAGTAAVWSSAATWFTSMSQVVGLGNLLQTSAATSDVISWNGSTWTPAGVETLIPTNSIALDKLAITGTAGQVVRVNAGATAFVAESLTASSVTPGAANQVLQTNSAGTAVAWASLFTRSPLQAFTTEVNWTHGLSYKPMFVRAIVVPNTSFEGYASGDEIDSSSIGGGGTGSFEPARVISVSSTQMSLLLKDNNGAGNEPTIINKSTKAVAEIEAGDYASLGVYFIYSNF